LKVDGISPLQLGKQVTQNIQKDQQGHPDFGKMLTDSLDRVNEIQQKADRVGQDFLLGKTDSVHKVTIAVEEAQLAYDLTLSIRDRILEGYRELMRMQF